jgi:cell wall-associated NlpC family hydrolase
MVVGLNPTAAHAAARPTKLNIASSHSAIGYGGKIGITVRLLSGDTARAIPGRYVAVDQRRADGTWAYLGTVRTDSYGKAVFARVMKASATFRGRHPGDGTWAASLSPAVSVRVSSTLGSRAVSEATRHYGKPYQYGAVGPDRFDCSGFTRYVYGRLGKSLPHNSGQQSGVTRRIDPSQKQVGDLIFTWTSGRISHVAIYAGNGEMWAATKTGDIVRKQAIYSRSYTVGRVV